MHDETPPHGACVRRGSRRWGRSSSAGQVLESFRPARIPPLLVAAQGRDGIGHGSQDTCMAFVRLNVALVQKVIASRNHCW